MTWSSGSMHSSFDFLVLSCEWYCIMFLTDWQKPKARHLIWQGHASASQCQFRQTAISKSNEPTSVGIRHDSLKSKQGLDVTWNGRREIEAGARYAAGKEKKCVSFGSDANRIRDPLGLLLSAWGKAETPGPAWSKVVHGMRDFWHGGSSFEQWQAIWSLVRNNIYAF